MKQYQMEQFTESELLGDTEIEAAKVGNEDIEIFKAIYVISPKKAWIWLNNGSDSGHKLAMVAVYVKAVCSPKAEIATKEHWADLAASILIGGNKVFKITASDDHGNGQFLEYYDIASNAEMAQQMGYARAKEMWPLNQMSCMVKEIEFEGIKF